jgi:kinesin family protein 5
VITRIRDLLPSELRSGYQTVIEALEDTKIVVADRDVYTFDRVFDKHSSQLDIYDQNVTQMLQAFFTGFNCTIFAYGNTSSGKSHTLGTLTDFD